MKLKYGPLPEPREWDRRDPDYGPAPLELRELANPWLWLAAVVFVIGLIAGLALVIAFVPGPAA